MIFKRLFGRTVAPPLSYAVPPGVRVYAIGDIHGRGDLFEELLSRIDDDNAARGPAEIKLILLGDLVDRGPDSAGVIDRAIALTKARDCAVLMGNHEELLLKAWEGDRRAAAVFVRNGGREALLSYGVSEADYDACDLSDLSDLVHRAVPPAHIAFIRDMKDQVLVGDYLFVHAGIRPGVPLSEQQPSDLRWIRREFLTHEQPHQHMIVHGHTITEEVDQRSNRIGIDTGAYRSNRLTAIALEGAKRWYLQTTQSLQEAHRSA